jgi:hypothetical protein
VRRLSRTFALLAALLLGAACAVGVAACGSGSSDDLIPAKDASQMLDQLDAIQSAVDRGRCGNVGSEVSTLQAQINDLSKQVDASLRSRLQEGVNNLADIGPSDCLDRKAQTQTQTVQTQTTETQTTVTTPTETTTTETTPTETTPPVTTTTETTPPVTTPTETTPVQPPGGATVPDSSAAPDTGVGGATPETATP